MTISLARTIARSAGPVHRRARRASSTVGQESAAPVVVMPREVLDRQVLRAILTDLPPPRRGSRLDPYLSLIRALRRRGRPYRDIVGVLREQCGVRVGLHTLFHFVRTRMPRPTPAPVDRPSTRRARAPSPRHAPPTP